MERATLDKVKIGWIALRNTYSAHEFCTWYKLIGVRFSRLAETVGYDEFKRWREWVGKGENK